MILGVVLKFNQASEGHCVNGRNAFLLVINICSKRRRQDVPYLNKNFKLFSNGSQKNNNKLAPGKSGNETMDKTTSSTISY